MLLRDCLRRFLHIMIDKDLKRTIIQKLHTINANVLYLGLSMHLDNDDKMRIEDIKSVVSYTLQRLQNEEEA